MRLKSDEAEERERERGNAPCHVPSASLPSEMGIWREMPMMLLFVWLTESSGPSSTCSQAKSSLTISSRQRSMSVRTSGSQFSLMLRPAEVCWRKRTRMPICACAEVRRDAQRGRKEGAGASRGRGGGRGPREGGQLRCAAVVRQVRERERTLVFLSESPRPLTISSVTRWQLWRGSRSALGRQGGGRGRGRTLCRAMRGGSSSESGCRRSTCRARWTA